MLLALAIVLLWLGFALLWVAWHGLDVEQGSPAGIFGTLGKDLRTSGFTTAEGS